MVSHQNKCIFIHIPKAAGTSLAKVFQVSVNKQKTTREFPFKAEDNKFDPPPPHLRASDYIKYGHVTEKEFRSYFKFSMVRNPWDRIVSEYKYRRHPIYYDFKTFLFSRLPKPSWSDAYCHVIPQYDFLYDSKGNCLVDLIGKVENIQEDFNKICNTLGMQNMMLPHANKSLSLFRRDNNLKQVLKTIIGFFSLNQTRNTFSHYTEYYDDESKEFVSELYKKDIETFSYDFGS